MSGRPIVLRSGDSLYELRLEGPSADGTITLSGTRRNGLADSVPLGQFTARAELGRGEIVLTSERGVLRCDFAHDERGVWVGCRGRVAYLERERDAGGRRQTAAAPSADEVRAPMTGTVVEVRATPGENVATGDLLVTIEAMKMEYRLTAPREGRVEQVMVRPGDRVDLGGVVARLASSPHTSVPPATS